ncbi:AMP nucleosidase [Alphaproteobacteria bacterium HT1-32]|nr:AMP nucleosidase [Alphaproteobacteria bacterium HT1-32]|tara:strand:- start:10982 stop:12454 length:1473 start_codon:yes stop_codon:yes gene_type:complete
MSAQHFPGVGNLQSLDDVDAVLERVAEIYLDGVTALQDRFDQFAAGDRTSPTPRRGYPFVGIINNGRVTPASEGTLSYGTLGGSGAFGMTLTRPELFKSYYREQLTLLKQHYGGPFHVGVSNCPIPLPFVIEAAGAGMSADDATDLQRVFPLPDLNEIDDEIANGTNVVAAGLPKPLSMFSASRVDYSLLRLAHYTGTAPEHFQRFVLFTNYQRYVDEFIELGLSEVRSGDRFRAFVEPGNVVTPNPRLSDLPASGMEPLHLPQMPAYHLVSDRHEGITLVNIGVGPSNAKTITDHLAVLRPHCWLMIGHCGGLRKTQLLGDYVLAHAYVRADHVLDDDLPPWVPVPPIAEIQIALTEAVSAITGVTGRELKARLRTGTVYTTDNRDWELRLDALNREFNQSRAIAIDMESATIAANGYRFRVPYGTLLCVSDKPLHGEIKLPGMANAFYRERVSQHMKIGIEALERLRQQGVESLHSRKLRAFDEPAFR